jgi:hypothetical protein
LLKSHDGVKRVADFHPTVNLVIAVKLQRRTGREATGKKGREGGKKEGMKKGKQGSKRKKEDRAGESQGEDGHACICPTWKLVRHAGMG